MLSRILQKLETAAAEHKALQGKRLPKFRTIKDPDPTAIISDTIDVPTDYLKELKKTKGAKTRAQKSYWNFLDSAPDSEKQNAQSALEKINKKLGVILDF